MADKPPVQNFTTLTQQMSIVVDGERNQLADHLTAVLSEATKASHYHKKKSKLTITITLSPGSGNELAIVAEVSSKIPTPAPAPFPAFANADGEIFLEEPSQRPIPNTAQFRPGGSK